MKYCHSWQRYKESKNLNDTISCNDNYKIYRKNEVRIMSNYIENMNRESINRFDKEMRLRKFRELYKSRIENGLTLDELKKNCCVTDEDIENFNIVEQEVKEESVLGEAFLKGFNGGR